MNELIETLKDIIAGIKLMIKATRSVRESSVSVDKQLKTSNRIYSSIGKLLTLGLKSDAKLIDGMIGVEKAIKNKKIEETVKVKIENPQKEVTLDKAAQKLIADTMGKMFVEFFKANKETVTKVDWPTDPKKPISVRLSDGKKFYNAIMEFISSGGGGVLPFLNATGHQKQGFVNNEGRQEVVVTETVSPTSDSILIDKSDPTNVYIGKVAAGQIAVTSSPQWKILRINTNGTTKSFGYANGSKEYNQVWDNRASQTYT